MKLETKFEVDQEVYVIDTGEKVKIISFSIRYLNNSGCSTTEVTYLVDHSFAGNHIYYEYELSSMPTGIDQIYKLKEGERYYELMSDGDIDELEFHGDVVDEGVIAQGNAFIDRREAEKVSGRRAIKEELRHLAEGYKYRSGEPNFSLVANLDTKEIQAFVTVTAYDPNTVYFRSKRQALKAIETIGRVRLLQEYFGIQS